VEGAVVLLGLAFARWPALTRAAGAFVPVLPYVVLAGGLLLGLRFARGRLWYALVLVAAAAATLTWWPPAAGDSGRASAMLIAAALPVVFGAFAFVPEDGPFGPRGRWLGAALAGLLALVGLLAWLAPRPIIAALDNRWLPLPLGEPRAVPHVALIAFLASSITLGVRAFRAPDSTVRGLLWGTVAVLIALHTTDAAARMLDFAVAGLALSIAMLEASHALAFRDELTGLPGRRAFDQAVARLSGPYVVAMVDVDHFKNFNDRFGHDVGDQVLRMVAKRLANVGGGGRAFRYGGEEFAVLFRGAMPADAEPHLEALRASIEDAAFTLRGADRPNRTPTNPRRSRTRKRDLSVTVSIGAAAPTSRRTAAADVVEAADKALYRAKGSGRNRVVSA
jgi:diguanylate cyclase (GGDEF)-like protein